MSFNLSLSSNPYRLLLLKNNISHCRNSSEIQSNQNIVEIDKIDTPSTIPNVCAHKTSLIPPRFIDVPVPIQKNEWSCMSVKGC